MYIHLKAFEKQLKNRSLERKHETQPIGSMIRFKRQNKGLTLEEAAHEICSISYLSKLENNLIDLSDKFADALFERLELCSEDHHRTYDLDHIYHQIITSILIDQPLESSFYDPYRGKIDHQSQLIMMAEQRSFKHFLDMAKTFERQMPFVTHFSDLELALHAYIGIESLYEQGYYDMAFDMLGMMKDLPKPSSQLLLLYHHMHLKLALKLHRIKDIDMHAEKMFTMLAKRQLFKMLSELQYMHLIHQCVHHRHQNIETMIEEMYDLGDDDKQYLRALMLIQQTSYQEALNITSSIIDKSEAWQIIEWMCMDQLGMPSADVYQHIITCEPKTLEGKRLKAFLIAKHDPSFEVFLEFIKREVMYPKDGINDYRMYRYIAMASYHHLSSHHYYKDAAKLLERLHHINASLTASSVSF